MAKSRTLKAICFGDLPRDMQQLLGDITGRFDLDDCVLSVKDVAADCFPTLPWTDTSPRFVNEEIRPYMCGVLKHRIPPLVVVGPLFVDGCHRLTAARRLGVTHLPVIDLTEIGISMGTIIDADVIGRMLVASVIAEEEKRPCGSRTR